MISQWKIVKKIKETDEVVGEFVSPVEAVSYITKNCKSLKKVFAKINENKDGFKEKNIKKKIEELTSNMYQEQTKIKKKEFAKIKKLSFKSCPHCSSKVNTEFFKNIDCPVCEKPVLSTPAKNKLRELQNKIIVEKNKLETVQKEGVKIKYLVATMDKGKKNAKS